MPSLIRPLHFVYKIANRAKTMDFYLNILNMSILRHEEFDQGCDAACNGPYDGKWSKTMVGYGDEDNNFVVELTYNYGVRFYKLGNDYGYLRVASNKARESIEKASYPFKQTVSGDYEIVDPDGYKFLVTKGDTNRVNGLSLFATNLNTSRNYWVDTLKGRLDSEDQKKVVVRFDDGDFRLILDKSDQEVIDHAQAFGRIAFACPTSDLKPLQDEIDSKGLKVLTRLITLDTPGKATVSVVILADPDGHEICFVGDEGFRELSRVDEKARALLDEAIKNDKSDEWHEKKNKNKA